VNAASTAPINLEGKALEKVERFAYLGSIVEKLPMKDPSQ
jgi:hypothetical protein